MTYPEEMTEKNIQTHEASKKRINGEAVEFYSQTLGVSSACAATLVPEETDRIPDIETALKLGLVDAVFRPNGMIEIRAGEEEKFQRPGHFGVRAEPAEEAFAPHPKTHDGPETMMPF